MSRYFDGVCSFVAEVSGHKLCYGIELAYISAESSCLVPYPQSYIATANEIGGFPKWTIIRLAIDATSNIQCSTIGGGLLTDEERLWGNYFLQSLQLPLPETIF
eukprot:5640328-Amphidinium_carterae.1